MKKLSARGEFFPSHCNVTGQSYERLAGREVGALLSSAGWIRMGSTIENAAGSPIGMFQEGLSRDPGLAFGVSSICEGIYSNDDQPSRLLHIEMSGSPASKRPGGFAKSCTYHKADSRLDQSRTIGLSYGVAILGMLVSTHIPERRSQAGGSLHHRLSSMDVSYVHTDQWGRIIEVYAPKRLRRMFG